MTSLCERSRSIVRVDETSHRFLKSSIRETLSQSKKHMKGDVGEFVRFAFCLESEVCLFQKSKKESQFSGRCSQAVDSPHSIIEVLPSCDMNPGSVDHWEILRY